MKFKEDEKLIVKLLIWNELNYYKEQEDLNTEQKKYVKMLESIIEKIDKEKK